MKFTKMGEWCISTDGELFSKVAVDTPILVRDHEAGRWCVRHFAEFKNGNVYAWEDGCTSWTAVHGAMTPWQQAKIAEE